MPLDPGFSVTPVAWDSVSPPLQKISFCRWHTTRPTKNVSWCAYIHPIHSPTDHLRYSVAPFPAVRSPAPWRHAPRPDDGEWVRRHRLCQPLTRSCSVQLHLRSPLQLPSRPHPVLNGPGNLRGRGEDMTRLGSRRSLARREMAGTTPLSGFGPSLTRNLTHCATSTADNPLGG
jgi:hypothetical protein